MLAGSPTRIDNLERLSAGASQEIWRFVLTGANGERAFILRRASASGVLSGGISLDLEGAIVCAAGEAGVPVAAVRHILTPDDGLGCGYIMDYVEGETLGGRIANHSQFATTRDMLAYQCGEILAKVHSIPQDRFPMLARRSPAEGVEFWHGAYRDSTTIRPVFELAFRWLADHAPPVSIAALVHGDFRNGNLMIGSEGVRAVLDWELAHVGDPMEDLGWLCVNSWRFGRIDRPVGGFGNYADLYAGYESSGGAPLDRDAQRWWEVFGTLRWGTMCAGSLRKFREKDGSVERALIARRASETEIDLLRLMEC
ncbi:phosphotransferase family protein [Tardiphaga sp. 215_C5_N2_1]|uniref:phosphotransferase family protein n=1 Tax=Tardiphaga sp. 215_C5_N2_1 TaxID=3240774 RepID=UPI003F8B3C3A